MGSRFHLLLVVILLTVATNQPANAEPKFVDLSPVANRTMEDDGIASNKAGGWSDEGVNDMFIFPPLTFGDVERNGHHFHLLDPATGKPTLVMLRGRQLPELPEQVKVPVTNLTGRYVYFLQNAVRVPRQVKAGDPVAVYTIHYADGSNEPITLEAGKQLRNWWTGAWWDNSGADSWPIFMGQNAYSMKWRQYIGVWAMRWSNPHPDKPISSITLASKGLLSPVIFAITVDDADYHASPDIKQDFKRPGGAPSGYFDGKLAMEKRRIFEEMVRQKMVRGVCGIQLIRPDMLAVTLDAWVGGGPGRNEDQAAALQSPDAFTIQINHSNPVHPVQVGRRTYEFWNGDIGPFAQNTLYRHTYYLRFAEPLKVGDDCRVEVAGIPAPFESVATLRFDPAQTITPVIKVNQVAYSDLSKRRYAYLGWWAADLGAVNYDDFSTFTVIDEKTNKPALQGSLTVRAENDPLSGEKVYDMDLHALPRGRYHIVVDRMGRSDSFDVGGPSIDDLYVQVDRAFYHQRAGTALTEPYTSFVTPNHHYRLTRSGQVVDADYKPTDDDPVREFRGGYHDAADFDVFTYHLRSTSQMLTAYELFPSRFGDGDLNIPESGNKIPDVLDEAHWALMLYRQLQQEDGGIPLGLGNGEDEQRDYARKHGNSPPYSIFPPETTSCAEYAAVAAQYSRIIREFDAKLADDYLVSAHRAFEWAQANPQVGDRAERSGKLFRTWAAAELYRADGKPADHQTFLTLYHDGGFDKYHWTDEQYVSIFIWPYIVCDRADVDPTVREALRKSLLRRADGCVKNTDAPAYRMGAGERDRGFGWGSANGGGHYADVLLRAYALTHEQRYLDAACLNADFQLGCNPLSKTFISGIGARPPLHPQLAAYLYTGPDKTGSTVKGITIFGLGDPKANGYPDDVPPWRRWRDLGNGGAEVSSEFTITETIGASSILYGILHALQP